MDLDPAARPGGHRSVPHTADLRVEAWAPSREDCLAHAVRGVAESFVDLGGATGDRTRDVVIRADHDEELLVALLEEVVYWLDTAGEVPVDVDVAAIPGGVQVGFRVAGVDSLPVIGAVPKAVTLHELVFAHGAEGWNCSVTLDV
ncbi:archease [Streptomyces sp. NPDC054841]